MTWRCYIRKEPPRLVTGTTPWMDHAGWQILSRDNRLHPTVSSPIFTAIPIGLAWCVKVISPVGEETRLGRFNDRMHALGAAALLAAQVEGQVWP